MSAEDKEVPEVPRVDAIKRVREPASPSVGPLHQHEWEAVEDADAPVRTYKCRVCGKTSSIKFLRDARSTT